MARSIWKNPFIDNHLVQQSDKKKVKTWSRRSVILPSFINKTFEVYNGKKFIPIMITYNMIGLKLGEFSPTRSTYIYKKSKK